MVRAFATAAAVRPVAGAGGSGYSRKPAARERRLAGGRAELVALLAELGLRTATVEHPPLFTVAESRSQRGDIPGAHTKNLFLTDRKGAAYLVVAEEDAALDLKALAGQLGGGRLSFGSATLLRELLGVTPGSVTPFAVMNDSAGRVIVVLEAGLLAHPRINAHPLDNRATTTIGRDDLLAFLRHTGHDPLILDLVRPAAAAALESRQRVAT
jgi:Ala-tRNA(Pro) deacylase